MKVVEQGDAAKKLLDNPIFQEAVAQYRQYIVKEWMSEDDVDSREYRWHEQNALDNLLVHLQSFVENGTYEKAKQKGWNKNK